MLECVRDTGRSTQHWLHCKYLPITDIVYLCCTGSHCERFNHEGYELYLQGSNSRRSPRNEHVELQIQLYDKVSTMYTIIMYVCNYHRYSDRYMCT